MEPGRAFPWSSCPSSPEILLMGWVDSHRRHLGAEQVTEEEDRKRSGHRGEAWGTTQTVAEAIQVVLSSHGFRIPSQSFRLSCYCAGIAMASLASPPVPSTMFATGPPTGKSRRASRWSINLPSPPKRVVWTRSSAGLQRLAVSSRRPGRSEQAHSAQDEPSSRSRSPRQGRVQISSRISLLIWSPDSISSFEETNETTLRAERTEPTFLTSSRMTLMFVPPRRCLKACLSSCS